MEKNFLWYCNKSLLNGVLLCSRALLALCAWRTDVLSVLTCLACSGALWTWRACRAYSWWWVLTYFSVMSRGGSSRAATSKTEIFVVIVNDFQLLTLLQRAPPWMLQQPYISLWWASCEQGTMFYSLNLFNES